MTFGNFALFYISLCLLFTHKVIGQGDLNLTQIVMCLRRFILLSWSFRHNLSLNIIQRRLVGDNVAESECGISFPFHSREGWLLSIVIRVSSEGTI